MTLIEVLASLVILGTVLALVVAARGRYTRQLVVADQRIKATALLDELIGTWIRADRVAIPVNRSGRMEEGWRFLWRTHVRQSKPAAELGARVVRVDVFVDDDTTARQVDPNPLLSVDLMVQDKSLLRIPGVDENNPATTAPATQESVEDPQTYEDPRLEMGVP